MYNALNPRHFLIIVIQNFLLITLFLSQVVTPSYNSSITLGRNVLYGRRWTPSV